MQHLLAFGQSTPGALTNSQLNAIPEQIFTRSNNRFQIPIPMQVNLAYASSVSLTRARLNTATLRLRGFPQFNCVNRALLPPAVFIGMDLRDNPLSLKVQEDLEVDITRAAGAGAEDTYAAVWVSDGPLNYNVNARDLRWIHFTAAVTYAAFAWSAPATIAFEDTLEGGAYNVYGMQVNEATNIMARIVFQNQVWRPGCLGFATAQQQFPDPDGAQMGYWGQFNTYSVPQIECIGDTPGAITVDGCLLCAKAA